MKKLLVGVILLLSAGGVLADNLGVEQSLKDMLASAKQKKMMSELKSPLATLGTGQLLLRDAIYLYNLPIYAGIPQDLWGVNCDIFQLVLDVEAGHTDMAYEEDWAPEINNPVLYPDRIYDSAAMFAYALYGQYGSKDFLLVDAELIGAPGVDPATVVGVATAFGYCYSTSPSAAVFLCNADGCFSSSEVNPF